MLGLFNAHNFDVVKHPYSLQLSKLANISYTKLDYGKKIQESNKPLSTLIKAICSSFGQPSHILSNIYDGPVYCWVISSHNGLSIIYIEYWKHAFPERMYIFVNEVNSITSSFIKLLYDISR